MIDDIIRYKLLWQQYASDEGQWTDEQWHKVEQAKRTMLVSYIHHMNVEEDVGTQDSGETQEVVSHMVKGNMTAVNAGIADSGSVKETENIYKAWIKLLDFKDDAEKCSPPNHVLLTLDNHIFDVHKVIMDGVLQGGKTPAGKISTNENFFI